MTEPEIKWVDGMPCIVVPNTNAKFRVISFGRLQDRNPFEAMPDIIEAIKKYLEEEDEDKMVGETDG